MKIILSRKGFDSGYGGCPSPILPNGEMLSLPIPARKHPQKFSELRVSDYSTNYESLIQMLHGKRLKIEDGDVGNVHNSCCHLDPDIRTTALKSRPKGWRGLFGQVGAALTHLKNNDIGAGDLFLFFGWFRHTVIVEDTLQYAPDDKQGFHALFGYLKVSRVVNCAIENGARWMRSHPHLQLDYGDNNALYVADERLTPRSSLPGWGTFRFSSQVRLSKEGESRTKWLLPDCFKGRAITYHNDSSWKKGYFKSADKGQEFVVEENKEITDWAMKLIKTHVV